MLNSALPPEKDIIDDNQFSVHTSHPPIVPDTPYVTLNRVSKVSWATFSVSDNTRTTFLSGPMALGSHISGSQRHHEKLLFLTILNSVI